ncbi:hypothetical protein ABFS83_14G044400 [Erythranthe nasuta]
MASTLMKSFLSSIVLFLYLVHMIEAVSFLRKTDVHIYNDLPKNSKSLLLHCASKNDDLGNHTLYPGQEFSWSFRTNIVSTTLFFCHFWWGSKQSAFDVFDSNWYFTYDINNYMVKEDGFYFSNDGDDHEKGVRKRSSW